MKKKKIYQHTSSFLEKQAKGRENREKLRIRKLEKTFQKLRVKRQRLQTKIKGLIAKGWQGTPEWFNKRGFKKTRYGNLNYKIRKEQGRLLLLKQISKEIKPPSKTTPLPPGGERGIVLGTLWVVMTYERGRKVYRVRKTWNILNYFKTGTSYQQAANNMISDAEKWIEEMEMIGYYMEETNLNNWKN